MDAEIEALIKQFGEQYRTLITSAIEWLRGVESQWDLDRPFRMVDFIDYLIARVSPKSENK